MYVYICMYIYIYNHGAQSVGSKARVLLGGDLLDVGAEASAHCGRVGDFVPKKVKFGRHFVP